VWQETLTAVRDNEDGGWSTVTALCHIIPMLPSDLLLEAFTIAKDLESEGDRATAMIAIVARLPEVPSEIFAVIKNIWSESHRVRVLTAIAPNLSSELLSETFDIAKDIRDRHARIAVLIALASPISKMPKDKLLPLWQTMRNWLSQQFQQQFAHHVLALTAVIYAVGGQEAVVETLMKIQEKLR
jgi:hypothetical protein